MLEIDGEPLVDLPLTERRARLEKLLAPNPVVQLSGVFDDGEALLEAATEQGLEGVMAKRPSSRYSEGGRGRDWLKIKTHGRQEFVICGYTKGQGRRSGSFGALVLGVHRGKEWDWVGNVGTGFNERAIGELLEKLEPLRRDESPLPGRPEDAEGAEGRRRLGRAESSWPRSSSRSGRTTATCARLPSRGSATTRRPRTCGASVRPRRRKAR